MSGYLTDFDSTLAAWQTQRGINPLGSGVELVSRERYEGRKVATPGAYRDSAALAGPRAVAVRRRPAGRIPVRVVRGHGLSGLLADFWDPSIKTSDWLAEAYGKLNFGDVPGLVRVSATDTPATIAARQRAAIVDAESSGDWSAEPRLGVTATDLVNLKDRASALVDEAANYKWLLVGGAIGLGILALKLAQKR